MNFFIKNTNDLTIEEKKEICLLFKNVFSVEKTLRSFDEQFLTTCLGYSFHGIIKNSENRIVGCYSVIPYQYEYFNKSILLGLSVDTMIEKEYRGNPFSLKKLANLVYSALKEVGGVADYGFPNDNVYLVRKKILKWNDIAMLDFFVLPINVGNIKPILKPLNFLTNIYASFICSKFIMKFSKEQTPLYQIQKCSNLQFINHRYNDKYEIIKNECYTAYIKCSEFDGAKVGYILDVIPLTKKNLEKATEFFFKKHGKSLDIIMYVGRLGFQPINLIKIPFKYQPKNVYMSGIILDKSQIDSNFFNVSNWNINLSNYDVV